MEGSPVKRIRQPHILDINSLCDHLFGMRITLPTAHCPLPTVLNIKPDPDGQRQHDAVTGRFTDSG